MKTVKFDIWGEYGHFKKFYTTSSPLTFSIPPVTAIYGILGAIVGYKKEEYIERMKENGVKVAVKIRKPIEKMRIGLNWIDTKVAKPFFNSIRQRTQIKVEFLKNPMYSIWVVGEDKFLDLLWNFVFHHKSFYTPYLGISECIANFGKAKMLQLSREEPTTYLDIDSVVLLSYLKEKKSIDFSESGKYIKERVPINMNTERQVIEYEDVLEEVTGKAIKVFPKEVWRTEDGENIIFF